jgi:alginate O-acetyltransferase complex protein AlgJ
MKRILLKSGLFLLPFVIALFVELFVLPIDFFTFRVWEAVVTIKYRKILPGAFYPNMELTKIEEGDLVHHTRFVHKRVATWVTDRYGYRKKNTDRKKQDIVIIGDSNIAGSGLTQKDILSEVLEEKMKVSVYPLSPGSIDRYLKEERFAENPPDLVVISSVERFIGHLPPLKKSKIRKVSQFTSIVKKTEEFFRIHFKSNRWVREAGVILDRFQKQNMLQFYRASLRRIGQPESERVPSNSVSSKDGRVFFLLGPKANDDVLQEKFDEAVRTIKGYDDFFKSKGIRFIFLPIPEKENLYHESLHTKRPVFVEHLISTLRKMGIGTVDTQKTFEEAFQKGVLLYHTNDTHWNENGVKIAADLIQKEIEEEGISLNREK